MKDSLGDRLKGYEQAFRTVLPKRLPLIVRVDGRAFHTLTKKCARPFDEMLIDVMNQLTLRLCEEVSGAQLAYVQSDEISIFIHGYKRLDTQPWFGNEVQKIVSLTAGLASSFFTDAWGKEAMFDSRVFILPEAEVANYFIWRQKDWIRNSITMVTRAVYSHKQVDGKNTVQKLEMLQKKGINWKDYPLGCQHGRTAIRTHRKVLGKNKKTGEETLSLRGQWGIEPAPLFVENRAYIEKWLALDDGDVDSPTAAPVL